MLYTSHAFQVPRKAFRATMQLEQNATPIKAGGLSGPSFGGGFSPSLHIPTLHQGPPNPGAHEQLMGGWLWALYVQLPATTEKTRGSEMVSANRIVSASAATTRSERQLRNKQLIIRTQDNTYLSAGILCSRAPCCPACTRTACRPATWQGRPSPRFRELRMRGTTVTGRCMCCRK